MTSKYLSPDFERFRKALLLKGEPDRVPLVEFWVNNPVKEAFLGHPLNSVEDEIEFWFKAGYDYVKLLPGYNINPAGIKPKEGDRQVKDQRNIYSQKEEEQVWASEGKGIITDMDDFKNYIWPDIKTMDFSMFDEAIDKIPEGMKIIGAAADIFTYVWQLIGFETFCFSLIENEELVERVFNNIGSYIYEIFTKIVKYDKVEAILYSDDIAYTEGLMVHPEVLRKYLFPWMKKIGELAKENNLIYIYHTDGRLWQVMEDLLLCGINGLHPIEPKAMSLKEVKEKYGQRLCLIGNVDIDRLARGTSEEIKELTKEAISIGAPGGGYCVGSSSSIPEYVPLENYRALLEASIEFGRY